MRLLALTKPEQYTRLKNNAITEIKKNTEYVYMAAFKQHRLAGMDELAC